MSESSPNSLVTFQRKKSTLWPRLEKIKIAARVYGHLELKRMYYSTGSSTEIVTLYVLLYIL